MTATSPSERPPIAPATPIPLGAAALVRRALDTLPGGRFTRSVAILAGGTALAQAVTIVAAPVLTRLYTPDDFGVLGVYVSLLGICAVVASLRYELAIPLPENDTDAAALVVLSLTIIPVTTLGVGFVLALLRDNLLAWTQTPGLGPYLWLVPIGVAFVGTYNVFNFWAIRRKAFPRIAQTSLTQGLAGVATQLALFPAGALGLVIGRIAAGAAGTTTLVTLAYRSDAALFRGLTRADLATSAWRYRHFPQFSMASGFVNVAGLSCPVLILSALYGPFVAGQFVLVQRVLAAPMHLVGVAVAQVYFSEGASALHRSPRALRSLFIRTTLRLAAIGSLLAPVVFIGAPWAFRAIFGHEWSTAGRFAQPMGLMVAVQFVTMPVSQNLHILERQHWQLAWDAFRIVLVVAVLVSASIWGWSAEWAVAAYGAAMVAAYIVLWSMQFVSIVLADSSDSLGNT